jgi:DNA-binding LytR/AlgR family response regulator
LELKSLIDKNEFPYDILITDVDLGIANAIELVKEIQTINSGCAVIFISNFLQFAPDVYDVPHVYFVWKANMEERLPKALERAITIVRERKNTLLSIRYQHQYHQIPISDITYMDALGRYITIHTNQIDYRCIRPLKEMEQELNSFFGRCHKSFIINFKYISTIQQNSCVLTNGATIPISYTFSKTFLSSYKSYIKQSI